MNQELILQQLKEVVSRIEVLEKRIQTMPAEIESLIKQKGFITSDDFILSGQATLSVAGKAYVPVQGVSMDAIAFAVYSDGTGSDIGSVIINNSGESTLYLDGIGTKTVYWVVFKTANNTL